MSSHNDGWDEYHESLKEVFGTWSGAASAAYHWAVEKRIQKLVTEDVAVAALQLRVEAAESRCRQIEEDYRKYSGDPMLIAVELERRRIERESSGVVVDATKKKRKKRK